MSSRLRTTLVLAVAILGALTVRGDAVLSAQPISHALTDDERLAALSLEAEAWTPTPVDDQAFERGFGRRLTATPRARDGEAPVVSVTPVGTGSTTARARTYGEEGTTGRRVLVTRYEYSTGLTVRTWLDLKTGDVLAVRRDPNHPAPLANEELVWAVALLHRHDPALKEIALSRPEEVEYAHMVPANRNWLPSRPGHRLVWLWMVDPKLSHRYLVDLSTGEVVQDPAAEVARGLGRQ